MDGSSAACQFPVSPLLGQVSGTISIQPFLPSFVTPAEPLTDVLREMAVTKVTDSAF